MSKIYKVTSTLVMDNYHKLNGEYIYDGEREETFEPTVHFDSREKAMSECERIVDKCFEEFHSDSPIWNSDKVNRKKNCLDSLERKNYCMITKYRGDTIVIKIKEISVK